jgi:hypothetical protein
MVSDYPSVSFKTIFNFTRLMKVTRQFGCLHVYVYNLQSKNKKLRVYSCKESALRLKPVWRWILYMGDAVQVFCCNVYVLSYPYNATHRPYVCVCALYGVRHKSHLVNTIQSSFSNLLCSIQHMNVMSDTGPGSVVRAASRRRARRNWFWNHPVGDFVTSKHVQTDSGDYPSSTSIDTGVLSQGSSGRSVTLTTLLRLAARLILMWNYTSTPSPRLLGMYVHNFTFYILRRTLPIVWGKLT